MTDPDPPEAIPAYIREGLERQDSETLRTIAGYADELADHRAEPPETGDLDVDGDERLVEANRGSNYTRVVKEIPCGKDACSTCPHGPYVYHVRREGGKLVWDYRGRAE